MSKRKLTVIELAGFAEDEFDLPAEPFQLWFEGHSRNLLAPSGVKQIDIFGEIGRDMWTGGGITPAWMREQLSGAGDITVNIDSPGGSFHAGNSIYSLLAQHDGAVTVNILGMAASAASLIAMAGDEIRIVKNGSIFIHNAHGLADGDHRAMTETAGHLKQLDTLLHVIYADRTGIKQAEIRQMMDGAMDGTLMTAKVAIEKGFADSILPENCIRDLGVRADLDLSATMARRALEAASAGKLKLTRRQHNRYFEAAAKLGAGSTTAKRDAGLSTLIEQFRGSVPAS